MRAHLFAILLALGLAPASVSEAGEASPLVVVELFTSQGCSSCPPADELLAELSERAGVLPLALHVDYWDYIGWADTFARPEHTARQKAYAARAGAHTIYTPQMVVAGVDHVVGFRPMQLVDAIAAQSDKMTKVAVEVSLVDAAVALQVTAHDGVTLPGAIRVDIVGFAPEAQVEIAHGENAGETITYTNIVESWDVLGEWDGQGAFEVEAELPDSARAALVLQEIGPGRVLAAYSLR